MEKINAKLNKYRAKLINATNPEKMEMYNLKMQQYMILQNRMIKSGGDYTIFAAQDLNKLTEDSMKRYNNTTNVYTVDSVQKFLDRVAGNINETSAHTNQVIDETELLTKQIIDTHRSVINQVNISEIESYDKITDALGSFRKYENTVIKYYVEELTNILNDTNVDHTKEFEIIAFELKLFAVETRQKILEALKNKNLNIPNILLDALQVEVNNQQIDETQQEINQKTNLIQDNQNTQASVEVSPESDVSTENAENNINAQEERAVFQPMKSNKSLKPITPNVQRMEEPAVGGKKRKSKKKYMDKLRRAFERANANLNILDE